MSKEEELLREIRDNYKRAHNAVNENRLQMVDDIRFAAGEQWPDGVKRERDNDGRPCLTINRIPQFIRQITGDMRQTKPSIKVFPVDSFSDPALADVYEGLIRQIEFQSHAQEAYIYAGEYAVKCGYGVLRVTTEFNAHDAFDQDIYIRRVMNPFSVYFDPDAQEALHQDGRFALETIMMSEKAFKAKYPKTEMASMEFDSVGARRENWYHDSKVRIAAYWERAAIKKTLVLVSDGSVYEKDKITDELIQSYFVPNNIQLVQERETDSFEVRRTLVSGNDILEESKAFPGRYIPLVPVYGESENIEGEINRRGVVRFAKDPQRLYNYWRTTGAELIALQPKAPYMVTKKQVDGLQEMWNVANRANFPYLIYNPDPAAPMPQRQPTPQPPAAIWQEAGIAADDMKAVTGIFDAALGNQSNETSGRAILARQKESDTGNYVYQDNLSSSIKHIGSIVVDLIPTIYDTNRVLRIRGEDQRENAIEVNKQVIGVDGKPKILNDITRGKYDVRVEVGASYSTKRAEAAEAMVQMIQAAPELRPLLLEPLLRNMDWPGAAEIAEKYAQMQQQQPIDPEKEAEAASKKADAMKKTAEAEGQAIENDLKEIELLAAQQIMGVAQ